MAGDQEQDFNQDASNSDPPSTASPAKWPRPEGIASTLTAFAIVTYGLGLLETNVYLLGFGISDFSVLKPRYVTTGILCATTIVAFAAFPYFSLSELISPKFQLPTSRARRIFLRILMAYTGFMPAHFLATFTTMNLYDIFTVAISGAAVAVDGYFILFVTLGGFQEISLSEKLKYCLVLVGIFMIFLGIFLNFSSRRMLPHIPASYGGVMPINITIIVKKDSITSLKGIGVSVTDTGKLESMLLLYETKDFLLVRTPEGRKIRLTSGQISGWTVKGSLESG